MKFYKCDACGDTFDPEDGMMDGWYTHERRIKWANPDGTKDVIKVKKTMKLYRDIAPAGNLVGHEKEVKLDLCRSCVMKFERP